MSTEDGFQLVASRKVATISEPIVPAPILNTSNGFESLAESICEVECLITHEKEGSVTHEKACSTEVEKTDSLTAICVQNNRTTCNTRISSLPS